MEVEGARAWLRGRFGVDARDVEPLVGGLWSDAFGFVLDDRPLVVRFGHHRDDYERDMFAGRLRAPGLPVPETIEIGDAFDGCYSIATRVFGEPLETLGPADFAAALPSLLDLFDALRAADTNTTTGFGGWDAHGNARFATPSDALLDVLDLQRGARLDGWREALDEHASIAATFDAAAYRLGDVVDAVPAERHVVHSDLINRNVFVADSHISGVFDWGCALTGDFVYDLAYLLFWAPWHDGIAASDLRGAYEARCAAIGVPLADLDARIEAAHLHIALSNLAYCAWAGRTDDLRNTAARLEQVVPL